MQALKATADLQSFLQRLANAPARLLMLDYDGTLAPFHIDPQQAVPYPGVTDAIEEISAAGTRVVIVSGRPALELPPLLVPAKPPEIWGAHGWERLLPGGELIVNDPDAPTRDALIDARERARQLLSAGARIEEKRASVALHWRGLPTRTAAKLCARAMDAWSPLAHDGRVEILPFDGGLEVRATTWNKETAVRAVMAECDPASAVAYLGDDTTDEDAFRAVKPAGIAVLVRDELRATAADVWLKPPEELLEFLRHWRAGTR